MTASRTASTAPDPRRPRTPHRARRLLAAALATLLAAAGLSAIGAAPAMAAGPAVSAPEVPAAGGTITVTGSGFAATAPGIYLALGPAGLGGFYQGASSLLPTETVWIAPGNEQIASGTARQEPMAADGTFTVSLTVPAASSETPAYAIYTSKAHGQGFADPSQNTITALTYAAPEPASTAIALASSASSVEEGAAITLTATVSPAEAAGTVTFAEGSTTLGTEAVSAGSAAVTTSTLGVGSHGITATFVPTDGAAFTGSTSAAATVTVTTAPQPTGPSVTVTPATGIDPAAGTLTVSGTGFSTTGPGFYVGVGPKSAMDNADWFSNAAHYQGVRWATTAGTYGAKINADGSVSIPLTKLKRVFTSNGASVDCAAVECGVYTFAAHGSADRSQDTYTPIVFAAPARTSVTVTSSAAGITAGTAATFTATVSPAAGGSVEFFDGTTSLGSSAVSGGVASLTTSALAVGSHAITATFTPADATVAAPATSSAANVTVNPAGVPTVSVPQVPAGGGTITVTGSGFSTTAPGIYLALGPAGLAGFYAGADTLIPTETVWIAAGNPSVTTGTARTAPLNADGTFSVAITVPAPGGSIPAYAIYTSKAHGQGFADPSQNTITAVTFAPGGTATTPTITLTTSGDTGNAGDPVDVTVRVTPAAEGTITVLDNGTVVAEDLRLLPDVAAPAARVASFASLAATSSSVTARVAGLGSGTHAFTASFAPDDPSLFTPVVSLPVEVVIAPAAAVTPADPAPVAAAQPTCVARAVGDATLDWGVKTSFRTYISGGIANGSWTLAGVTYSDGQYSWSGGRGTFNPEENRGLVRYSGSVSFTGHDGVLNLVLSNLAIRVTSPTQATLIADVHSTDMGGASSDHSGVSLATIALGGGTASGSTFSVDGAATALTADGAKAFAGFYNAGDALDPISFRFPLGAEVVCDSTTTSGLASTGSTGTGAAPLFGGLLILAGLAAVAVVRRRAVRSGQEATVVGAVRPAARTGQEAM
jgi:hypothetical protein